MEQETSIEKAEISTELSLAIARINELHAQADELAQKAKEVAMMQTSSNETKGVEKAIKKLF